MNAKELTLIAEKNRKRLVEVVYAAKAGHIGGDLSCLNVMTALYFHTMRGLDPQNPKAAERDRFVLSKGHCVEALYTVLESRRFIQPQLTNTLGKFGSVLSGQILRAYADIAVRHEFYVLSDEIYEKLTAIMLHCPCDMSLTDIGIDTAHIGLHIDITGESDKSPLISLMNISNTFTPVSVANLPDCGAAFALCTFGTSNLLNSSAVKISSAFDSALTFNTCTFPGQPSYSVRSEGRGRLSFVNCKFVGWRNAALSISDIIFTAANTSFNAGKEPVLLADKSVGMLASCSLSSGESEEESALFVISTENEYDFDVLEKQYVGSFAVAPEIKDRIFYAKDYGLSESNADNYNAVQSAINYAYMNGGGTVFIPAGQYRLSNEVLVKEGVRVMGAGAGTDPIISTVFITEKNAGEYPAKETKSF